MSPMLGISGFLPSILERITETREDGSKFIPNKPQPFFERDSFGMPVRGDRPVEDSINFSGGMGMLQQGQMGPLSGLGQYINQELEQQNQGEVDEFIGEVGDMANQRFGVDLGSVGQRPMFMAGGGAAFPDLSGDGKITQKDILMGRGVIPKQYGGPIGMENGGPTTPAPELLDKLGLTIEEFASLPDEEKRNILGLVVRPDGSIIKRQPPSLQSLMQDQLGRLQSEEFKEFGRKMPAEELDRLRGLMPEAPRGPTTVPMPTAPQGPRTAPMPSIDEETMQQLLRQQSLPQSLAEGGMAMPMPPQPAPPMPMEAAAPQEQLDPNVVQQALSQAAGGIASLDEAQNYEDVMNSMRGDQASVEQRRQELAGVVGPGDAGQTPDSVLTLVQPVMMLANVDQGIGGLAQEEMTQPMEGPMAQGIMSTVPEPPMEAGGTAPVNFNKGGEVRPVEYFDPKNSNRVVGGGNQFTFQKKPGLPPYKNTAFPYISTGRSPINYLRVTGLLGSSGDDDAENKVDEALNEENKNPGTGKNRLNQLFESQLALYRKVGLGDDADRSAMAEQQKRMTKAQMLFDIASTALAFAAPMEGERPGLSPAERLAMAARSTQLPEKIGARAQAQLQLEKESAKEERAIELAALQSAETKLAAEKAAAEARAIANLKKTTSTAVPYKLIVDGKETTFDGSDVETLNKMSKLAQEKGGTIEKVGTTSSTSIDVEMHKITFPDGSSKTYNLKTQDGLDEYEVDSKKPGAKPVKIGTTIETISKDLHQIIFSNGEKRLYDINNEDDFKRFNEDQSANPEADVAKVGTSVPAAVAPEYMQVVVPGMDQKVFNIKDPKQDKAMRLFIAQNPGAELFEVGARGKIKSDFRVVVAENGERGYFNLNSTTDKDRYNAFIAANPNFKLYNIGQEPQDRAPKMVVVFNRRGVKEGTFNLNDVKQKEEYNTLIASDPQGMDVQNLGTVSVANPKFMQIVLENGKTETYNINDPEELIAFNLAKEANPRGEVFGVGTRSNKPHIPSYMKVTDNATGVETVIDGKTQSGIKLIEKANAANLEKPGSFVVQNIETKEKETRPDSYLIPGKGIVLSYDKGKTYTDKNGTVQNMPQGAGKAFRLSSQLSYEVYKKEQLIMAAQKRLDNSDDITARQLTRKVRTGTDSEGRPTFTTELISREEAGLVRDAMQAARSGTGPWANFSALIDSTFIAAIPISQLRNIFQDTQANRQFIRAIKILGSSALSVSPRMAVYDLARVEKLFPDPDKIFTNPRTEANKLVVLKQILLEQQRFNDSQIAQGITDNTLNAEVHRKQFEIERLLGILSGVKIQASGMDNATINQLRNDLNAGQKGG